MFTLDCMLTDVKYLVLDLEVIFPLLDEIWELVNDFSCLAWGELHVIDLPIFESLSIDLLRDVVLKTDFNKPLTSLDLDCYFLEVSVSP